MVGTAQEAAAAKKKEEVRSVWRAASRTHVSGIGYASTGRSVSYSKLPAACCLLRRRIRHGAGGQEGSGGRGQVKDCGGAIAPVHRSTQVCAKLAVRVALCAAEALNGTAQQKL